MVYIKAYGGGPPLHVVSRKSWGAQTPDVEQPMLTPVKYAILNYSTGTPTCDNDKECREIVKNLQKYHMEELEYPDIAFNFLIGGDGTVYKGRGWEINAERPNDNYVYYNGKCQEIALIGDYRKLVVPTEMMRSAEELIKYGVKKEYIDPVYDMIHRRD